MRAMILQMILLFGIAVGMETGCHSEPERAVVVTRQEIVREVDMNTVNKRPIYGFKGIRYAKPPVGDLRFRTPGPADPWYGTCDPSGDGDQCPRFSPTGDIVWKTKTVPTSMSIRHSNRRGGSQRPVVTLPQGSLRGISLNTTNQRTIYGFKGIPYAKPPLRDLRFKAPEPADCWSKVRDAGKDGDRCPQFSLTNEPSGNEDCLYINVYTPQLPSEKCGKLLPVMLFYHGGAWQYGSNNSTQYGPENLLMEDILLVIPNYRLGILGFLSTGDAAAPGNAGLKDQVFALEWTRDYIKYFGGDPDRITIAGQSVGGATVEFLSMIDRSAAIINGVIAESGSILSPFAQQPRIAYAKRAFRIGKIVGCKTESSEVLVDCLRNRSFSELMIKQSALYVWRGNPRILWGPTVEPKNEGAVVTETAEELCATGRMANVSYMTGVVQNEGFWMTGVWYANATDFRYFLENFDELAPYFLFYYNQNVDRDAITAAAKEFYFGDNSNRSLDILRQNMTDLASDMLWNVPSRRVLDFRKKIGKGPNYFYSFNYRGEYSWSSVLPPPGLQGNFGAVHLDELLYLYPQHRYLYGTPEDLTNNDRIMRDIMVDLWTSFVIHGKPSSGKPRDTVGWKQYSSNYNHLQIGEGSVPTLSHKNDFYTERMTFWKDLIAATYHKKRSC